MSTQTVEIAGRKIEVRNPTDAQLTLMHRSHRLGSAALSRLEELTRVDEDKQDKDSIAKAADSSLDSTARLLDVIEGLIIDPVDRNWLVSQMSLGVVELNDVIPVLQALTTDDKEPKKPVKKATRGDKKE